MMFHYRYNSYLIIISVRNYEIGFLLILEQRSKLSSIFRILRKIVSKRRTFCTVLVIYYRELDLKSERSFANVGIMIGDDSLGLVAARANRPAEGTRGANEWVIVEPGQALAAAGQERKTLLAHISSSPSLSFSRSRRSFIFIRRRLFLARRFFLSAHFFRAVALSHSLLPYPYCCRELEVFRWYHPLRFSLDLASATLTIDVYVSRREKDS